MMAPVETNEEAIKALMSIVMDIGIRPQKSVQLSFFSQSFPSAR